MKYNTQAYNYKTLFCLPVDWKKPKVDNQGSVTNDTDKAITGSKRNEMENNGDGNDEAHLPAKKRHKIMCQNKEQFKDTCAGFNGRISRFTF